MFHTLCQSWTFHTHTENRHVVYMPHTLQISIHPCTGAPPPHHKAWIFQLRSYMQTLIHTLEQTHTSQFYACSPKPVIVCSQRCHAVFISAEASSEPCVVPVTIPSPQRQWNLPRKNTIISSPLRERSAGENKRVFTFVRQCTSWNSYSTQFEEWNNHQSLSLCPSCGWRALFYGCNSRWSSLNWLKKQHYHHFTSELPFSTMRQQKKCHLLCDLFYTRDRLCILSVTKERLGDCIKLS